MQFHLDSGTQRKDAHRFYEREGMTMNCLHFAANLTPGNAFSPDTPKRHGG